MPSARWRFAKPRSMRFWRSSGQSIDAYRSSSSTGPRPSVSASESRAVASVSPRAVASFEPGSRMRAVTIASTRLRCGEGTGSMSRSRRSVRSVPSTAATWPWGRERTMSKASSRPTSGSSLSSRRRVTRRGWMTGSSAFSRRSGPSCASRGSYVDSACSLTGPVSQPKSSLMARSISAARAQLSPSSSIDFSGCLRRDPDEKREGPVERDHVRVVEFSEDFAEALLSWG